MSDATRRAIPALLREQLALDELDAAGVAALEREFGADHVASVRAQVQAESAALAERFAPASLPTRAQLEAAARLERERRASHRMQRFDLTLQRLVLAGVALLAVSSPLWLSGTGSAPDGRSERDVPTPGREGAAVLEPTRIKGGARILVFRKRGEVVEPLGAGDSARSGDLLQLGYDAGGRAHGVLLSLDGRGVVTLHHPRRAGESTALQPGGKVLLPSAYALDDAPRFERFVLLSSAEPIDVARALESAERLARDPAQARSAPLPVAGDVDQTSLVIGKVTP